MIFLETQHPCSCTWDTSFIVNANNFSLLGFHSLMLLQFGCLFNLFFFPIKNLQWLVQIFKLSSLKALCTLDMLKTRAKPDPSWRFIKHLSGIHTANIQWEGRSHSLYLKMIKYKQLKNRRREETKREGSKIAKTFILIIFQRNHHCSPPVWGGQYSDQTT